MSLPLTPQKGQIDAARKMPKIVRELAYECIKFTIQTMRQPNASLTEEFKQQHREGLAAIIKTQISKWSGEQKQAALESLYYRQILEDQRETFNNLTAICGGDKDKMEYALDVALSHYEKINVILDKEEK